MRPRRKPIVETSVMGTHSKRWPIVVLYVGLGIIALLIIFSPWIKAWLLYG